MASHEYILALDGLPGIESEIGEYLEYINVQTKRYIGNSLHERIVRCKDCKHCKPLSNFHKHLGCYNDFLNKYEAIPVCEEGFCAWGELKEEL